MARKEFLNSIFLGIFEIFSDALHRQLGVSSCFCSLLFWYLGSPGGSVVKNSPASAGDTGDAGLIPLSGRSPGGGNSNPLQYSCLENPMDGGAWWAVVHRVAKRRTQPSMLAHVLIFRTKLYFQVIMSIFLQIFLNIGFDYQDFLFLV